MDVLRLSCSTQEPSIHHIYSSVSLIVPHHTSIEIETLIHWISFCSPTNIQPEPRALPSRLKRPGEGIHMVPNFQGLPKFFLHLPGLEFRVGPVSRRDHPPLSWGRRTECGALETHASSFGSETLGAPSPKYCYLCVSISQHLFGGCLLGSWAPLGSRERQSGDSRENALDSGFEVLWKL